MKSDFGHRIVRLVAILALCTQALLPGTLAVAQAASFDISNVMCTTPGTVLSDEARAQLTKLAKLIDENAPDPETSESHCPFCTTVQAATLPVRDGIGLSISYEAIASFARYEPGFSIYSQGPPLGSRGPPSHL